MATTAPSPRPRAATYRVQLHAGFTFDDAAAITGYLAALGVTHLYCSPYLQAAPGSTHGYDVVDHGHLNSELGGAEGHRRLVRQLASAGLGQVLDIVPNHMALAGRANAWWWDVLENGPSSRYASYFDIDWDPPERKLAATVLMPVLGDHYGRVLEAGELVVVRQGGSFAVRYHDHEVPVSPRTLDELLAAGGPGRLRRAGEPGGGARPPAARQPHRPGRGGRAAPRQGGAARPPGRPVPGPARCRGRHRRRGRRAERRPRRARRPARPAELPAGLLAHRPRRSSPTGGSSTSRRWSGCGSRTRRSSPTPTGSSSSWCATARSTGCGSTTSTGSPTRRDTWAGCATPPAGAYVVVEKILEPDEELPRSWPVAGTTGYDFLNRVNQLFVDPRQRGGRCAAGYARFTGRARRLRRGRARGQAADHARGARRRGGAPHRPAGRRLRAAPPPARPHPPRAARRAARGDRRVRRLPHLRLRPGSPVSAADRAHVAAAVSRRQRSAGPTSTPSCSTSSASCSSSASAGSTRPSFAVRFAQVSAPVMAKGVEDTAFYRYHRWSRSTRSAATRAASAARSPSSTRP